MSAKAEYLVRLNGGYALRFSERFYEVVSDAEATRFPSTGEAYLTANNYQGLRGNFTVEAAPTSNLELRTSNL
jgi:hypothetical protein